MPIKFSNELLIKKTKKKKNDVSIEIARKFWNYFLKYKNWNWTIENIASYQYSNWNYPFIIHMDDK